MFFNSFSFVAFFLIVLLILLMENRFTQNAKLRNATLLAASYIFYGWFNVGFLLILMYVTVVNYIGGWRLNYIKSKWVVGISVVLSLLPLIFYKYSFFLLSSVASLLHLPLNLGFVDSLILPVGISFFTFQALSYTIDIYRGKIERRVSVLDFALFVSFFPTILSGPIEKARNLLPQIQRYSSPVGRDIVQGVCIFLWGLFKKIVVADRLAAYVDWAYGNMEYVSGLTLALAAIFYSIQIYCDFSGYSDMALGVARALGFNVTKNFHQPYFSHTIKSFWRKWHISLTSWFTEYVYFSLGGNRVKYKIRWVFNIMSIFVLSGIWHGAAWNFLIWGVLHGVYYLLEHFSGLQSDKIKWNVVTQSLYGVVVFIAVTIAWIFFRLESFGDATFVVSKIFTDWQISFSMGPSSFTFASMVLMLFVLLGYELMIWRKWICFDNCADDSQARNNLYVLIPICILLGMFGLSSESFVYFQF